MTRSSLARRAHEAALITSAVATLPSDQSVREELSPAERRVFDMLAKYGC